MSSERRADDEAASSRVARRRFLGTAVSGLGALAVWRRRTTAAAEQQVDEGADGAPEVEGGLGVEDAMAAAAPTEWPMDGFDLPGTRHPRNALAVTGGVSEVWEFDVSVDHVRDEEHKTGTIEYASPTVADGKVLVGDGSIRSDRNYLHAIDVETGEHVWRKGMPEMNTAVAVGDGRVYAAGNASHVVGIDLETGQELWKFGTGRRVKSSPKYHDGSVYVGCNDGKFYAVDPEKGFRQWAHDTSKDAEGLRIFGSQPIHDGTVYVNTWAPKDQGSYVYGLDADSGREEWKFEIALGGGNGASPLAVGDEQLFVPDAARGELLAFDLDGHEQVWKKEGFEFGRRTAPAVADCRVVVGTLDAHVTAVDVDSGEWAWRSDTRGAVEVPPVVANGTAYVIDREGWLYGFALKGGEKRFEYEMGILASTSPRIVDGDVVAASRKHVYRLTGDRDDHRDLTGSLCGSAPETTTQGTVGTTADGATTGGEETDAGTTAADAGGDDGDRNDDGADPDDGSTPGFGLAATATGLAATTGVLLRRARRSEEG